MTTFFAFLHHLAAFALVSALAVEFVLIGQTLSVATAKRLQSGSCPGLTRASMMKCR